jgi:hypothetical protein
VSPFRKPTPVVRRRAGEYVRGVWEPSAEPLPETVLLGIQPATPGDYERLQANPEGRRIAGLLRAYGPVENPLNVGGEDTNLPGDLVLHEDRYWLVIGRHVRDILGSPVSHTRYLLAREIEAGEGEVVS